ncbi:MAG: hypothetical protein KGZ66_07585 [Selenomonadales bacterium]|nr:hypothetical protein [Selenomonadales bacterium]
MDVYVGRQPIFDRRMKTYGYELLYRRSQNNFFEGLSDNQATAELINNVLCTLATSRAAHALLSISPATC